MIYEKATAEVILFDNSEWSGQAVRKAAGTKAMAVETLAALVLPNRLGKAEKTDWTHGEQIERDCKHRL